MQARAVATLMLAAAVAGCGGQPGPTSLAEMPHPAPVVEVTNQHAQDMKVYLWLEPGLARWRLGTVAAHSSATLVVPRLFWGRPVRLVLRPFASASEEFTTTEVTLDRGWVFVLQVQSVLSQSFVFTR